MVASSSFHPTFDIPASWRQSVAEIISCRWRKVLIIGHSDAGKSTYCAFLSRQILASRFDVAIVDADIGQKDIGPPATITLGYPTHSQSLAELQPANLYFVGTVDPARRFLPMLVGSKQLVDAAQSDFVLINTTGFIHGAGRILKSYKIEALQPDIIVALERGTELRPIIKAYGNYRIRRLRPSRQATSKTPVDRMKARQQAFSRYFQTAHKVTLLSDKLIFQRGIAAQTVEKNLLCGVTDRHNKNLGLAIITDINAKAGCLSLFTPVAATNIRVIQGGDLYLSLDGRELGRK